MNEIWARIEKWAKSNIAPGVEWWLSPGATKEAIQDAEEEIGMSLPQDLRDSYLIHNGCEGIFENHLMLSIEEIPTFCKAARRAASNENLSVEGPMQTVAWDFAWLPFTDCAGPTYVCVDQNPTASGASGQIIKVQLEFAAGKVLAPNFRTWLATFADDLEAGEFKFDMDYEMVLRQNGGWLFRN